MTNRQCMFDWANWLWNNAPILASGQRSWGSQKDVDAWIAAGGYEGILAAAENTKT